MVFLLRLIPLILLFSASPAMAGQTLIFRPQPDDLRLRDMAAFLLETKALDPALPYDVAAIDLNNDGVDEAIFRQQPAGCRARADCPHVLTGLTHKKPVLLGTVAARKIGISSEKSYGVTGLIIYNSQNDDFAYKSFVWNAYKSGFALQ